MKHRGQKLASVELRGLRVAPGQVWGGVRLVPLIRDHARDDLRLFLRRYHEDLAVVSLDGGLMDPSIKYISYVPHGLVVSFSDDGTPAAAFGSQLIDRRDGKRLGKGPVTARVVHRMVKREAGNQLRFLPLHLAMEGFLALHFGGPDLAWSEYSRRALSRGLSPRIEWSVSDRAIAGLNEALRVFEIHEGQCGVLVYVADALASAFVVPHPDDYRALHESLLLDFYGRLLYEYGHLPYKVQQIVVPPSGDGVVTLEDLRGALARARADWADMHQVLSAGLLQRPVHAQGIYRAGPFLLQRFMTHLEKNDENHLGECIVRDDGTLEYLKTYRLSHAQTERAMLLQVLFDHKWNLEAAAASLTLTRERLILRLCSAGFGYLFKPDVVTEAYKKVHGAKK